MNSSHLPTSVTIKWTMKQSWKCTKCVGRIKPWILVLLAAFVFAVAKPSALAQTEISARDKETLEQIQADVVGQRWEEAQSKLETAASALQANADFHFLFGVVLLHGKELVRAAQEADRAVVLDPGQGRYYLLRGQVYEKVGNHSAAKGAYEKSIELEPTNPTAVLLLVKLHVDKLRPADAIPPLQQALNRMPESPALHYELGRVQEMLGRPAEAVTSYSQAVELNPRLALAHAGLGRLYRSNAETLTRSAEHLKQAVALDPQNPQWHYELGLTLVQQQNWEAAQTALEQAAVMNPNQPRIYSALAQVYRNRKMAEKARDSLRHFGELASRAENAKVQIGELETNFRRAQDLESSGNQKDAISLYQQILAASPNEPQVYFALARLHLRSQSLNLAEENILYALKLQPNNADYHEFYAVVLIELGRRNEAERELHKAIPLKPLDGSPHNLLGDLFLGAGQIEAAVAAYKRAVELAPKEPEYRLNLARAYRVKGDAAAAEREVNEYQKLLRTQQSPQ